MLNFNYGNKTHFATLNRLFRFLDIFFVQFLHLQKTFPKNYQGYNKLNYILKEECTSFIIRIR